MSNFRLTVAAKNDLKNIALYTTERWGLEQRNTYLRQLDEQFKKIAHKPNFGKPCDYIKSGYRKAVIGSHLIFYICESSELINVIRILHRNSDIDTKF